MDFDTYDYAIGGKLVTATVTVTDTYNSLLMGGDKLAIDEIKRELMNQLTEYMIDNKLVEFTRYTDPIHCTQSIKIRAYLAPDSDVKILRVYKRLMDS